MASSKNASLLRGLILEADALASRTAKNKFPILLKRIAETRRVTSVEFRPLLVDAMLITHNNGFRILFNSDGKVPSDLKNRFETECYDRLLSPRLRFSLAHELAHTLFYDLTQSKPKVSKQFKSGGRRTALENLELNCNEIASHLLLPTSMLRMELLQLKNINAKSILELASKTGVSVEMLIRRLNRNDSLFIHRNFKGSILLAEQTTAGIRIRAIAKHRHLNIARDLTAMLAGDYWELKDHRGIDLHPCALPSTSSAPLTVESYMVSGPKNYTITKVEIGRSQPDVSFLMVFEESTGLN